MSIPTKQPMVLTREMSFSLLVTMEHSLGPLLRAIQQILCYIQLQKPSGNYTGACVMLVTQKKKAGRDPEGQQNPALLSPLSLCMRHLIQRSPQHTHLLYSTVLSSRRRNQSKALINHPPQDISCSRSCAKYQFILGLTILGPSTSHELHFLFKCSSRKGSSRTELPNFECFT